MQRRLMLGTTLCAVVTWAGQAAGQERLARCPWSADEKYFGTDSFVPDWRKAEDWDAKATARFMERYWPKFRESHDKGGQSPGPEGLTEEEKAAGIVVFPVDYMREVLPAKAPTPAERKFKSMSIFAAKGESEPLVIGIQAFEKPIQISVETTDLTGEAGKIEKADITNRLVLAWAFDSYRGRGKWAKKMQQVCLLKTPGNKWKFPAKYTMCYWVDVHVPAAAKEGTYTGQILVKADGKVAKTIGVSVAVLPLTLKTNNFHVGSFGLAYKIWAGGFLHYHEEMAEMDSRYGYNMAGGWFNKGNDLPFAGSMEQMRVDESAEKFKKFDAVMKRLARYGMGQVAFWNWGSSGSSAQFHNVLKAAGVAPMSTPQGKKGFAHMLRAIKQAEVKHAWPELVICPYESALRDPVATRRIIEAMPLVHKISPTSRVYMTDWHVGYTRLYQSSGRSLRKRERMGRGAPGPADNGPEYTLLEKLGEKEPVFNFHVMGAPHRHPPSRAIQERLGAEFWDWMVINRVQPKARLAHGVAGYSIRADASQVYYNYQGSFDKPGAAMHYVMPDDPKSTTDTRGPVIASLRAAIAREGIDDRKYIEALKFYARTKHSAEDLKFLSELLPAHCAAVARLKDLGGLECREGNVTNANAIQKLRAELRDRLVRLVR